MARSPTSRKRRTRRQATPPKRLESQLAQQRAFDALRRMREEGQSLTRAARETQTTPRTMRKYVGPALSKDPTGRYSARRKDRLKRSLRFLTPQGVIALDVQGSRVASQIARYWAAVDRYLRTGLTDEVSEFRAKTIRVGKLSYPFVTDPRTLGRLANAGQVSFEDLYVLVV